MRGRSRSHRPRSSASAPTSRRISPRAGGRSGRPMCWLLGYPALRVQHHYLAFVTLAFNTLVYLIFRNEEWLTGGIYGITNVPRPELFGVSMARPREFYYFCLAHLALVALAT